MDLKEFISETLQQLVNGVQDAQEKIQGDGEVNPHIWMAQRGDAGKHKILESNAGKWIHPESRRAQEAKLDILVSR